MTQQTSQNNPQETNAAVPQTDKEINFQRQRQMYENQLAKEREEKSQMQAELQKYKQRPKDDDDEDDSDNEPYVDHKKLKKTVSQFGNQLKQETSTIVQQEVQKALAEERRQNWMKQNSDFQQVMSEETVQKFAQADPDLASTILEMPDTFERQKLVYRNIKALGLDKPVAKQPSIQEKIDANRRSPYYQPSGMGNAPYQSVGDFSEQGQKNAYEKMKELKNRLRLG